MSKLQFIKFYVSLSYRNTDRHCCSHLLTTDYRGNGPAQQSCCHTEPNNKFQKVGKTKKRMGHYVNCYVSVGLFFAGQGLMSKILLFRMKTQTTKINQDRQKYQQELKILI